MKCVCKRLFTKQKITCLDCFGGEKVPPTGSRLTNLDGANVCCMVELRRAKASSLCMKLLELVFTGGLFSKPTHCLAEFNLGCCIVGVVKAKGFESLTTLPISLEAVQCLGFAKQSFLLGLAVDNFQHRVDIHKSCIKAVGSEKCQGSVELDDVALIGSGGGIQSSGVTFIRSQDK